MILIAHQIEWTNRNISIKHPSHEGQNWKLVHLTSPLNCWITLEMIWSMHFFKVLMKNCTVILFNNKSNSLAILFGKRILFLLLAHIVIKIWNADNYQSFDTPNPPFPHQHLHGLWSEVQFKSASQRDSLHKSWIYSMEQSSTSQIIKVTFSKMIRHTKQWLIYERLK